MTSTSRIMKDLIDPANFDPRDYDMIKDLNDTKFLWKIAVRIVDIWYVQKPPKPGHLEMIFMDSKGDKIQVSVKKDEFLEWHEKLKEHHTYEIHNFAVVPNDLSYKACTHPYRLNFNCGTTLREKHFEDIPFFEYDFKSFSDILGGKYRTDILIDVIGDVDKITKSQPNANTKMVSFVIKDLCGEYMNCTLWDQLAIKFMDYHQKANESDLTVIILTHARIKEPQGNYSVSVANSWNGSRLLINEDIVEIHNFKKSFGDVEVVQPSSQRLTQMSGYSQFSEQEKFMYKAQVMSIEDISKVIDSKEITAVTVGTVVTFIIGKTGWYYQGEEKEYLSSYSVDKSDANNSESFEILTPEFLSTLTISGLPNHRIKLKIGTPIMLLRNLDQSEGFCNGTRLIVTRLANHVIEAKIISGKNIGNIIYISRMSMSPSQSPWPFKLVRRQFPIVVSYAMTINKSQGQSLAIVGLYLPRPVFSHGQLYVAFSRVQSKQGLKILIHDKDKKPLNTTTNVVFKEVF